jgi:hypothetical protein
LVSGFEQPRTADTRERKARRYILTAGGLRVGEAVVLETILGLRSK